MNKTKLKIVRETKQKLGICSANQGCKNPPVPGITRCEYHASKNKECTKNIRARRKAAGICVMCKRKAKGHPAYADYCEFHGLVCKGYLKEYISEGWKRYEQTGSYKRKVAA